MTILELFRWVKSHTLESSRRSDSNEEHRAPVVDCTQVPFGNAAAGKVGPAANLSRLTTYGEFVLPFSVAQL